MVLRLYFTSIMVILFFLACVDFVRNGFAWKTIESEEDLL